MELGRNFRLQDTINPLPHTPDTANIAQVIPDAGARSLAVSLHNAFDVMQKGLQLPQSEPVTIHRQLAFTFVNLSQAYRDLVLDISVTRFKPSDVETLRNLMQAVIRSFLSLRMESHLFDDSDKEEDSEIALSPDVSALSIRRFHSSSVINIDGPRRPKLQRSDTEDRAVELVASKLAEPTSNLLSCLKMALQRCDAVLMDMSGHRVFLGPSKDVSSDIVGAITSLRKAKIKYDAEEEQYVSIFLFFFHFRFSPDDSVLFISALIFLTQTAF